MPSAAGNKLIGSSGVTLIEMLVALVIITCVAAIAAYPHKRLSEVAELRSVAEILASRLRETRSSALTRGRDAGIRFEFDHNIYLLLDSGVVHDIPHDVELSVSIGSDIEPKKTGTYDLIFSASGFTTEVDIRLSKGSDHRDIRVDGLSGRVSVSP